jgi:hypothetical protein
LIILQLKNKPALKFNLKNFEREQVLCSVVEHRTAGEIKLQTTFGEQLEFKVKDVESCKFNESEYVRGTVQTGPLLNEQRDPMDEQADKIMDMIDKNKKRRVKTFMHTVDEVQRRKRK